MTCGRRWIAAILGTVLLAVLGAYSLTRIGPPPDAFPVIPPAMGPELEGSALIPPFSPFDLDLLERFASRSTECQSITLRGSAPPLHPAAISIEGIAFIAEIEDWAAVAGTVPALGGRLSYFYGIRSLLPVGKTIDLGTGSKGGIVLHALARGVVFVADRDTGRAMTWAELCTRDESPASWQRCKSIDLRFPDGRTLLGFGGGSCVSS